MKTSLRYTDEMNGSIKYLLMKEFSTLENDLTMILEFLTEMVEKKELTEEEFELIVAGILDKQPARNEARMTPGDQVIKSIMNYSQALELLQLPIAGNHCVIVN